VGFTAALGLLVSFAAQIARAQCSAPANAIVAENCLPGSPSSEWDIPGGGAGDPSIQGYATDISVNVGQTVNFKINTNAAAYTINIYRMGYYGGSGARKVATVVPSANLPQTQPPCLTDSATKLVDCGNWALSAFWTVPANATSGIYFAHLIRTDTGGSSHIVFIVRNDTSKSAILFQTADETWQAYNSWGGNSLYGGLETFDLPNRAYKVSYNRPFNTRGFSDEAASWVFGAEYPMVRWLEFNGYDVTYFTGVDAARNGALITNHMLYLSVGHDEYWSGPQRANVQAALAAGVNLTFFSSNEIFWKTRWENSIDGTNTAYRTLVCYKETLIGTAGGGVTDPADPPTWTGTWRDPRFSPPADGGFPENALSGTLFTVNGPGTDNPGNLSVQVPAADGKMRFWRNTAVASLSPGSTYVMPPGTLGYEWDEDIDNGFRPAGLFHLSTAMYILTTDLLLDFGATYGAGTATHHIDMYRAPSGALVLGAGSTQWSWGLDSNHDNPFFSPNAAADPNMQQATVNLFADMGVQPATLQAGLVPATKSTDTIPPVSVITAPTAASTLNTGTLVTISGTATDLGGGGVGGVEVSYDGGHTWHPATGRGNWTYSWTPSVTGTATIESRAVDDSGNIETPSSSISVTVVPQNCPCEAWNSSVTPSIVDSGDAKSVEVGVKFRSDVAGYVTGIRFYKSSANTGIHIGNLWSSTGTLLAAATFTNETTSGWQQVNFTSPVQIAAGTTYVASYFTPSGHYSADVSYFNLTGFDNPPIHLVPNSVSPNGVYSYSSTSTFPTSSFKATNYWVDLVFTPSTATISPASLTFTGQTVGTSSTAQAVTLTNTGATALSFSGITITGTNSGDFTQTNNCGTSLAANSTCTINVTFAPTAGGSRSATLTITDNAPGSPQAVSLAGTGLAPAVTLSPQSLSFANQLIGTSSTANPVTLSNTGNASLSLTSIAITGTNIGDFSQTNTCGTSLAAGANCTISVTFTPTTQGTRGATLAITDNAPGGPQTVSLSGAGVPPPGGCPCSIWDMVATPATPDSGDPNGVEVGVKFTSSESGSITGVLFYKSAANAGAHIGNLWTTSGTRLATGTFTNETASGWQQMAFSSPVPINANTTYVASYYAPGGHYSGDGAFFASSGVSNPPLQALANSASSNGVYAYGSSSSFPQSTYNATNYWVDAIFVPNPVIVSPGTLTFASQTIGTSGAAQAVMLSNTGTTPLSLTGIAINGTNSGDFSQTNNCGTSLAANSNCTINVVFTPTVAGSRNAALTISDNALGSPQIVGLSGTGVAASGACPCSIWSPLATPATIDSSDPGGVELGVKFSSSENGWVTGIRFYKSAANTGIHIGNLWTTSGTQLATITFTNETAPGWQQMNFSNPVPITANTPYVASYYAPAGHYSGDNGYFAISGVNNSPLQAPPNSISANGVYTYGPASSFPQSTYQSSNYWVDVVFNPGAISGSPTSLAFSGQTVGTKSGAQTVTLSNTGGAPISLSSITITGVNSGDFGQTNTCGASLAPGGNCTISVTFTPTATGTRGASLSITDSDPSSPQSVNLSGTGQ
jgi:hypothetical protein